MSTDRPRHILLVVENLPLARDHRLRKQAAALVEAGYRVSVICRRDPGNTAIDGVRVYEYRPPVDGSSKLGFLREYGYSLAVAGWLIATTFVRDRFDAIQISGTPDIYFLIAAPLRLFGVRLVFDQRDLSPELYELRYGRRGVAYRLLARLERASYRCADHVVTVNHSLERIAYERGDLALGTVSVIGNGPLLAHTVGVTPRPELKRGRGHLCCWVGVMGPQDRVEVAVQALAHLVHGLGRTDCHVTLVGDGESRAGAQELAAGLGVSEFVSFPGWLDESEAFAHLATADLGIEPNLEDIVSPVKVMEYLAFGLPVVAFDVSETRRLAGDAAAYATPRDVQAFAELIDALLDDPPRCNRMGELGRQRVRDEIAWDRQSPRYVDVFASLVGRPTGRQPIPLAKAVR